MKKRTFTSKSGLVSDYYKQKRETEKRLGRKLTNEEFEEKYLKITENTSSLEATGISIFDPALCEVLYAWFSREGDTVIDPFAGGSVRGIVASVLGRHYTGVDLRDEQVEANRENAAEILDDGFPVWHTGDSTYIKTIAPGEYDFILTCPPYGDLEVYSDDDRDLSNMSDDDFDKTYVTIMRSTAELLKRDRFAAVVVGNYRDKNGFLRDLCGLTIRAMESGGARYYNEIIYLTPIGSVPVRITKQFNSGRKIGKIHQNVLIFCKGDPKKATERLGEVVLANLEKFREAQNNG